MRIPPESRLQRTVDALHRLADRLDALARAERDSARRLALTNFAASLRKATAEAEALLRGGSPPVPATPPARVVLSAGGYQR